MFILSMNKFILWYHFFMFGKRLKELRLEVGLTQKELAEKLNCDQSMIARWESCKNEPTESNIIKVAKFFEVSSDYLIGLSDN